jgi:lipoyl-dependent peroxiredoxin subunit D
MALRLLGGQAYLLFTADQLADDLMRRWEPRPSCNNVFYRGRGFVEGRYDDLRPGLWINIIANPGVEKANFELWCLAVSSINGCSHCMVAHEHTLRAAGIGREAVLEALKAAAIVSGVAQAITAAQTLAAVG